MAACRKDDAKAAEAIRALVAREVEAINKKDMKALSEVWSQAADIRLFDVSPPGRFQGWSAIARDFKEFFDRFSEIHLSIDGLEVRADGDLGYATYDWTLTGKMGEEAVGDHGQATAIYRREKDGWRLAHAHYSPAPPGSAAPPPVAASGSPAAPADTGAPAAPASAAAGSPAASGSAAAPATPAAPGDAAPSTTPSGSPPAPGPAKPK
jgi:uncharacterized protein (TIGR02246 family)